MTQSNTRLDAASKVDRRELLKSLRALGGEVFSFPNDGITIAIQPAFEGSRTMHVAVAVASPEEKKFRRKVGEYVALCHLVDGIVITVPRCSVEVMGDFAADLLSVMRWGFDQEFGMFNGEPEPQAQGKAWPFPKD